MVQFRLATSGPLILLESLGSISLVTVPLWELQFFFFLGGLFPTPGHTEKDSPLAELLIACVQTSPISFVAREIGKIGNRGRLHAGKAPD